MSITDLKFEIDRESKTPLWLQIRNELFNENYLKLSIGKKRHLKIELV